jgi:NitT/TauT family transport system ATP-binding protein
MADAAGPGTAPSTAPSTAPGVTVEGVAKRFRNGTEALTGVDLTVAPGSFLTLLGPSGCGKSTLLRIIAGLAEPSAGRVGRGQARDARKGLGFVFQEPTLMPWATVFDNVYLPLRLLGQRRREAAARVEASIAAVGLAEFARAYPRELSGGMRMRVSIARALVTEPRLLLLDEPFAALDEFTRFKLNEDLLRLWGDHGWTVIFVTHSVFESVFLSSRIVVMSRRPGRIVADLPIVLPYPRDNALRMTPGYAEYCRLVSQHLNQAMA